MKTTTRLLLAWCAVIGSATARDFDLIIRNGTVVDGTGSVRQVFVNGVVVVKNGRRTLALAGRVLNPVGCPAKMDAAAAGQ